MTHTFLAVFFFKTNRTLDVDSVNLMTRNLVDYSKAIQPTVEVM